LADSGKRHYQNEEININQEYLAGTRDWRGGESKKIGEELGDEGTIKKKSHLFVRKIRRGKGKAA